MRKIALILAVCILGGCAQLEQLNQAMKERAAKNRLEIYSALLDKAIVDKFYDISSDGMESGLNTSLKKSGFSLESLGTSVLSVEKKMFSLGNMGEMHNKMNRYSYNGESDPVAVMYLEMATDRGNTIKLYKPRLTKIINSIYKQPFEHMEKTAEWYGVDNTLIEFDDSGNPVSLLTRAHQALTSIGVNTSIYFGLVNIRHLENKIPNSVFQDNFIRELRVH